MSFSKIAPVVLFLALSFAGLAVPLWPESNPAERTPDAPPEEAEPEPEFLIPGLPEILSVFDKANNRLIQSQLDRLGDIRSRLRDQFSFWSREQTWQFQMHRYGLPANPWAGLHADDSFRRLSSWLRAVNDGFQPESGYRDATLPLQPLTNLALNGLPADQQLRLENLYGALELWDGSAIHAMRVLGSIRRRAEDRELAMEVLQHHSFENQSSVQRQKMVLNRINAASLANLRSAQDTNNLLVALLEQRLAGNKLRRDAEVRWMNRQIAFALNAGEAGRAGIEGSAEALRSFSIR